MRHDGVEKEREVHTIGLNLLYLLPGEVGGTETYARELLSAFARIESSEAQFVVFVNREAADWPLPEAPNFTRVVCPVSAVSRGQRYRFEQLQLPRLARKFGVAVLHSLGYVAPLRLQCPSVVTIHDLNYRAFGAEMSWPRRLGLEFFVRYSARRAARIIAVSDFSRQEIVQAFGVDHRQVRVIHEAAREEFGMPSREPMPDRLRQLGVRKPYIIAFSSRSPNKNIPRLLRAFSELGRQYELPHQLVLVGHPALRDQIQSSGAAIDEAVRFTGFLPDDELRAVLGSADMLAFPSVYEGFGLPVLEAMALGVPVACSNQGSLPEIAGEAAVFFDPYTEKEIAAKLAEVALNPKLAATLIEKGYENVKRFSWDKTGRRTLGIYREITSVPR